MILNTDRRAMMKCDILFFWRIRRFFSTIFALSSQSICLPLSLRMIRLRSSSGPDSRLSYRRLLLLSIIVFSIFWPSAHANCYYPDGTDQNRNLDKSYFQPCDPGDEHSMCCALNMTTPEECRSDGLCHNLIDRQLWREGCTDPTWKSSKCIKLYVSGLGMRKTL